jgi:Bardet-Biedl syndrome 5 protein
MRPIVYYYVAATFIFRLFTYLHFPCEYPSLQRSIRLRESKFGRALVIETYQKSGGYILGFRLDPVDKLEETYGELKKLWEIYAANPNFGVSFTFEDVAPDVQQLLQPRVEEDTEVVDDEEDAHAVAAYYAVDGAGEKHDDPANSADMIVYEPRLGLAVEKMGEGVTIESLWRVV